jgi:hypothetical protein
MASMKEEKVIKIDDGIYNGTYSAGDELTINWKVNTNSFKAYYNKYYKEESEYLDDIEEDEEWEMYGELKGWTEDALLFDFEREDLIEVPIKDIENICM